MSNDQRRRERKRARRAHRQDRASAAPVSPWGRLDDLAEVAPPPEDDPVWTVDHCPVADRCAGCGSADALRVNVSWFGPDEVCCATVCPDCEGSSMVQLVGIDGLAVRVAAHREHVPA